MRKLAQIRTHLIDSPLDIDADQVNAFGQNGTVHRCPTSPGSFIVEYDGHVIVRDYPGEATDLLFVVLAWVDKAMPGAADDAVRVHVDIIDHKRCDVSFLIRMCDTVRAETETAGTLLTPQDDADIRQSVATERALGFEP